MFTGVEPGYWHFPVVPKVGTPITDILLGSSRTVLMGPVEAWISALMVSLKAGDAAIEANSAISGSLLTSSAILNQSLPIFLSKAGDGDLQLHFLRTRFCRKIAT